MIGNLALRELLVLLAALVLVAYPACRICSRIGYSPWLGLLAIVPIANLGLLLFVAFSSWPVDARGAAGGIAPRAGGD